MGAFFVCMAGGMFVTALHMAKAGNASGVLWFGTMCAFNLWLGWEGA